MRFLKIVLMVMMAALLLMGPGARAGIEIPVGNPIGITSTLTTSSPADFISSVTVTLDISGGNNGDLYGYLSYDGQIVTLLDRPGVSGSNPLGATGSGFTVTLSDLGGSTLNTAPETSGAPVTGTYNVNGTDGNNSSTAFGTAFDGLSPDGTWTLFLANDVSGGESSELVSWSVSINAVPEPTNVALGIFGVCAVAARLRAARKKFRLANSIDNPKLNC